MVCAVQLVEWTALSTHLVMSYNFLRVVLYTALVYPPSIVQTFFVLLSGVVCGKVKGGI